MENEEVCMAVRDKCAALADERITARAQETQATQESGQGAAGQDTTTSQSPSSQTQSQQTFQAPEVIVTATKTKSR